VRGDVTAPTLAVGAGAVLEGRYSIGGKHEEAPRKESAGMRTGQITTAVSSPNPAQKVS
jgi:hypothetical protein